MKAGYGEDMLLAVMSAYGCSPAGGGVATAPTDAPVYLDGVFVLEGQWMSGAIEVTDADGIAVPVEVVYDEPYDDPYPGDRVAVAARDGWEAGASYVAGVEIHDFSGERWAEFPFVVSPEFAPPLTEAPSITLDEIDDRDTTCGYGYTVSLTPASADPSGWSTLLVEHQSGHRNFYPAEPATVSYNAEGPEYCLRVTQIDATGARSTSEWTCADYVLDPPCGCGSDVSALLFVGVLGLGLKRRTRPSG
jgi:hypothetical protein